MYEKFQAQHLMQKVWVVQHCSLSYGYTYKPDHSHKNNNEHPVKVICLLLIE